MGDKFCVHCGEKIHDDDKFCIYCGRPVITKVKSSPEPQKEPEKPSKKEEPKKEDKKEEKKEDKKEDKKDKKKVSTDLNENIKGSTDNSKNENSTIPFASGNLSPPEEKIDDDELDLDDKSKGSKKKKVPFGEEDSEIIAGEVDIDEKVREQLELKMELGVINYKKEKLIGKLDLIMKDVKTTRYEEDLDFAKEVNAKLDYLKGLQKQFADKINEINKKIDVFRIDELDHIIEERRAQLTELTRKFKLGKIQESVFEQLKREYAGDYNKAKEEIEELQKQIKIWVSKLKGEKNREEIRMKTIEARYTAKEINKERFEEETAEHQKAIDLLDVRINVLQNFTGK